MATELAQTNPRAEVIASEIKGMLQSIVFDELKREYGQSDSEWWTEGVPRAVRSKVVKRQEENNRQLGDREAYFDLLDYRAVIQENWDLFTNLLGYGRANASKARKTAWIVEVNDAYKIVSNPSAGGSVSLEAIASLESILEWLIAKASGINSPENESA